MKILSLYILNYAFNLKRQVKQFIVLILDLLSSYFSIILGNYITTEQFFFFSKTVGFLYLLSISIFLPLFWVFGFYKRIFRFSSMNLLHTISVAFCIYGFFYYLLNFYIDGVLYDVKKTIGIIQPILFFIFLGLIRSIIISLSKVKIAKSYEDNVNNILIYGAGRAGKQLLEGLSSHKFSNVIGFIDDNKELFGKKINNYRIYALSDIEFLINKKGATHIFLALPSVSNLVRKKIINKISEFPIKVKSIPSLTELAYENIEISKINDLKVEDIVGRDIVKPNYSLLEKENKNSIILISGAGGSIGSELCKQLILLKPKIMILVEMNEHSLYLINQKLSVINEKFEFKERTKLIPILNSLDNNIEVNEIFNNWNPTTVYHAAAYKHVNLVEKNYVRGLKNNIISTLNLAKSSIKFNVKNFIMISTDKAVNPSNIMGVSKRISEIVLQSLQNEKINNVTKFSAVRFGNVLKSSGSVIPLFQKQIEEGGPVTVTHKDVSRFFMSIPEAAQLVLQSSALSTGGDIFLLEMGEQIKIYDLAKLLIKLSGLTLKDDNNPDGDIEIKIIGLRDGEKLREELHISNNLYETVHKKIFFVKEPFILWGELEAKIDKLFNNINAKSKSDLISEISEIIPEFKK